MELTKPIVDKINEIIDQIAKEEHYDFIFDTRSGAVVFAKKSYDITEKVLKIINSQK
jgi:Skp family chaperone for outer membrane proteins